MFQFFNCYLSNFLLAFWYGDFKGLSTNLVVQLVAKQIGNNCVEYVMFKYYTGAKVDAVEKRYKVAIKNEEKNSFEYKRLKVCMHAEK